MILLFALGSVRFLKRFGMSVYGKRDGLVFIGRNILGLLFYVDLICMHIFAGCFTSVTCMYIYVCVIVHACVRVCVYLYIYIHIYKMMYV